MSRQTLVRRIRWALAALIVVPLVALVVVNRVSGPAPQHFAAELTDASELVKDNAVRLNDVIVGKVTSIRLDGLTAKVGFTVAHDVHLPAGTRIEVRQTSLLGELYLAVVPDGNGQLRQGATIPLARTRRAAELEQVVGLGSQLVDNVTVDNLNKMIHSFDRAYGGRPDDLRRFFDAMANAADEFDSRRDQLATTIDRTEQLAAAMAPHTQTFAQSLDRFAAGMKAIADQRDKLGPFTTSLRQLSDSATTLIANHEDELSHASAQTRQVMGEIVANLGSFEQALQAIPDFNRSWACVVKGNWIEFMAGVYPEVARVDTGGGHCHPDQGPRGVDEQGQVQVNGVPDQNIDDPAHTGDVNLGAGTANQNRPDPNDDPQAHDRPSSDQSSSPSSDGGLTWYLTTTGSGFGR